MIQESAITDMNPAGFKGLSLSEVPVLQQRFGKNIFQEGPSRGFLKMIAGIVQEPMFILLSVACLLYFVLGEISEGLMMLTAMVFVGAISLYQEVKSSHALEALRQYTQPHVTVIRASKEQIISSDDLVPGDIMVLEEGSRIPADAVVVHSNDFTVNESIVTGESLPVDKNIDLDHNRLYQGTTVNSGKCYAHVTATGNSTLLGQLGKSVASIATTKTMLQHQMDRFVRIMAFVGLLIFLLVWLFNYLNTFSVLQSLLIALTLAMAIVPEEIPVAFSSFMALGAFHMAKRGIITRQPLTIENLGAVSVICLDKTGTITENRMEVQWVYSYGQVAIMELNESTIAANKNLLLYARLASEAKPFDAMEIAIVEAFERFHPGATLPPMIKEYPLAGRPPMMTHVYADGMKQLATGKGAPERIIEVCKIDEEYRGKLNVIIEKMAADGYRLLGVCSAVVEEDLWPPRQDDFEWRFEGLLALYDPPKRGVENEFKEWRRAGIAIKLVTGDYKETAANIAAQVGIMTQGRALEGNEIMSMSGQALQTACVKSTLFARMFPEAKLRLIETLKASGAIVAMLGDGVNDGPALKASHIGIAMGHKGTEIAREAADLILTDDELGKVTEAIRQGRKIYLNLKKAVRYIISIHIPIILTASIPLLLGWRYPNVFTPIHVIFLEIIMGPTCSVFFEREPVEPMIMHQPPRPRTHSIFTASELLVSFGQGLMIAAGTLALYYFFMRQQFSLSYVRTIVFTCLIISNVFLTFANRSFSKTILTTIRYKNSLVPYFLILSLVFLLSFLLIPPIRALFGLATIRLNDFYLCLGVSVATTMWFELFKGVKLAVHK